MSITYGGLPVYFQLLQTRHRMSRRCKGLEQCPKQPRRICHLTTTRLASSALWGRDLVSQDEFSNAIQKSHGPSRSSPEAASLL